MKTRDQIGMIDLETGKLLKEICILEYKLIEQGNQEGIAEQNFETEEYKTADREQAEQEISEL